MARVDGREARDLRAVSFQRSFTRNARALHRDVHRRGRGQGWLTAEYAMLPSASDQRKQRDRGSKPDSRATEIQRLIGRDLRGVVDSSKMTERTVWIDCDLLQASGGTRTAAISGAWVALHDLFKHMERKRVVRGCRSFHSSVPFPSASSAMR